MTQNPYEILGVAPDAHVELIKAQYRLLVRENHPDIAPDKEAATGRMVLILDAWRTLSDPDKRQRLDDDLKSARDRAARPVAPPPPSTFRPSSATPSRSSRPAARPSSAKPAKAPNPRARLLAQVYEAANLYFREGRAEDAISLCQRVLKADPKNFEATVLMGDIFAAQNRSDKALVMYERAQILQPQNILVRRKRESLRPAQTPAWTPTPPPTPAEPEPSGFFGKLKAKFGK